VTLYNAIIIEVLQIKAIFSKLSLNYAIRGSTTSVKKKVSTGKTKLLSEDIEVEEI